MCEGKSFYIHAPATGNQPMFTTPI